MAAVLPVSISPETQGEIVNGLEKDARTSIREGSLRYSSATLDAVHQGKDELLEGLGNAGIEAYHDDQPLFENNFSRRLRENENSDIHTDRDLKLVAAVSSEPTLRVGTFVFEGLNNSEVVNRNYPAQKLIRQKLFSYDPTVKIYRRLIHGIYGAKVLQPENGQLIAFDATDEPHGTLWLPKGVLRVRYLLRLKSN